MLLNSFKTRKWELDISGPGVLSQYIIMVNISPSGTSASRLREKELETKSNIYQNFSHCIFLSFLTIWLCKIKYSFHVFIISSDFPLVKDPKMVNLNLTSYVGMKFDLKCPFSSYRHTFHRQTHVPKYTSVNVPTL